MSVRPGRPSRWQRRLYRAPIAFFRWGLAGWIRYVAAEWILVTTRGRRTGRTHAVLVDLLRREGDVFYVQSAYGRSDWVRNAEVAPEVRILFRGREITARARVLSTDEARPILGRYVAEHPVYSRVVAWFLGYRGPRDGRALRDWLAGTFLTLALAPVSGEQDSASGITLGRRRSPRWLRW